MTDELVNVGACVWVFMDMMAWCGQGWRWWVICIRYKAKGIGRMSGDAGALPECEVIHRCHPITPPSWCNAHSVDESELIGLP